jgi:hypothetical protein
MDIDMRRSCREGPVICTSEIVRVASDRRCSGRTVGSYEHIIDVVSVQLEEGHRLAAAGQSG